MNADLGLDSTLGDISCSQLEPTAVDLSSVECICSIPPVRHKSCTISCVDCGSPVQLACLLQLFKQNGEEAFKNKHQWLKSFIDFYCLRYSCLTCRKKQPSANLPGDFPAGFSSLQHGNSSALEIKESINLLNNQISDIQSKISDITVSIKQFNTKPSITISSDKTTPMDDDKGGNEVLKNLSSAVPPSYANVVSKDIEKVVHSAVAHSLKLISFDDKASTSVFVYGMSESKEDMKNVSKLLDDDKFHSIVQISRIGKFSNNSKKTSKPLCRPLKVEFQYREDRDWVLRNSKSLINSSNNSQLRISRCLTASEQENVKKLREKCDSLNKETTKCMDGKNKFVVINNKIMQRDENGKLIEYMPSNVSNVSFSRSGASPGKSSQVSTFNENNQSKTTTINDPSQHTTENQPMTRRQSTVKSQPVSLSQQKN